MKPTIEYNYDGHATEGKDMSDVKVAEVDAIEVPEHDGPKDVWGDLSAEGPNYRGLGWIRTAVILCKTQIGLGVLAIPSVLHTLGFVPGILVILAVGAATTWTDWIVGSFKLNHPEVYTAADAGFLMWGPIGREILGGAYWLYLSFVAGAGLLGISTAFNALTDHATCTAVFVLVGAIITIAFSSIQTLDRISWIGWVGLIAILGSVITLAIATGVQDRPSAAPPTGPWDRGVIIMGKPDFVAGISAVANVIFSYAGTPNFFAVISEQKEPKHYFRALYLCQTIVTLTYVIVGSVVYYFCGQYVSSPALGSAGPLLKKVCYGLALPGLIAGCVLNTHLPAKYLFVRILRNSKHLTNNSFTHNVTWYGCILFNCTISFLVAEAIPIFGDLISFVGAFLSTPLAMTLEGLMYNWDCRHLDPNWLGSWRKKLIHGINYAIIAVSVFCMVAGTYGAIVIMNNNIKAGNKTSPFSCADNSK